MIIKTFNSISRKKLTKKINYFIKQTGVDNEDEIKNIFEQMFDMFNDNNNDNKKVIYCHPYFYFYEKDYIFEKINVSTGLLNIALCYDNNGVTNINKTEYMTNKKIIQSGVISNSSSGSGFFGMFSNNNNNNNNNNNG